MLLINTLSILVVSLESMKGLYVEFVNFGEALTTCKAPGSVENHVLGLPYVEVFLFKNK